MDGPGIGKSTYAAELFSVMKKLGYNVELVTEYAKDCVYEKQFQLLNDDQLFVLANQNRRLQRIIESERITYYMSKNVIYVFKEYEHGNGITLGVLNLDAELDYKNMKVKS